MFGLYRNPIPGSEFVPPTIEETSMGILESHAKGEKDINIALGMLNGIDVFDNFLQASRVLIKHSSSTVRMILNDMSFRKLVNRGTLDDSMMHFISEGGHVTIDILRQSTEEVRRQCMINLFDGSNKQVINTHKGFKGDQGDIVIGDKNRSAYMDLNGGGNINFGSTEMVRNLLEQFTPEI